MNIYMYNVWFGDCFRIENDSSNLMVDFGLHQNSCIAGSMPRDEVHAKIAAEILKYDVRPNLLITHFHQDHISGLLYMRKNLHSSSPVFTDVYIPDIWDIPNSVKIVSLHLLEELLRHYKLSKASRISLLDLVRFLCADVKNVFFIRRGSLIESGKYIALWPDPDIVGTCANMLLKRINLSDDFFNRLNEISKELCSIVLECVKLDYENRKNRVQEYLGSLNELEKRLIQFHEDPLFIESLSKINMVDENLEYSYLNSFKNNISIVFQNKNETDENLLFTGDLEREYLKMISVNYNLNFDCNMHSEYCYIKVPHHGTYGSRGAHYFDFTGYNPKVVMIPNGMCMTNSYKICSEYSSDIKKTNAKVYCSNSNWCMNNVSNKFSTCTCSNFNIIFPNKSKIVKP